MKRIPEKLCHYIQLQATKVSMQDAVYDALTDDFEMLGKNGTYYDVYKNEWLGGYVERNSWVLTYVRKHF